MNRTWTAAALLFALAAAPAGASHVESLYRIPPRRASETAGGLSQPLAISADGRYTVIASDAANLVPGMATEPPGTYLFLYDRGTGTMTRISRRPVSGPPGDPLPRIALSADGRFLAFESPAKDELEDQRENNLGRDIFLWDRVTGETELVSHSNADPLRTGDFDSREPAISADGRFVAFSSSATDLLADNPVFGGSIFLWDRRTDRIVPVSHPAGQPGQRAGRGSLYPSISADGRFVAFLSAAPNLVAGQVDPERRTPTMDAFLWDRTTRQTVLVSRTAGNPLATGNRSSSEVLVSADGRFVALASTATDLLPGQLPGLPRRGNNIYLWERATGAMTLVSHGPREDRPVGRGVTFLTAVSANGSHVLFGSDTSDLLPESPGGRSLNVFLWSRATGRNTLLSRSPKGRPGNGSSFATGLSADGAWAVFYSIASNLVAGDDNHRVDAFLANGRSGRVTLLSVSDETGEAADGDSFAPWISADGRWIAFAHSDPGLVAGVRDLNTHADVILTNREGDRKVVTVHPPGLASATPQGSSFATSIDASGRFVVFTTNANASQLVPGVRELDADGSGFDVFLYDRELRTLTLVTRSANDPRFTADGSSREARISADGRWVTFTSEARDLLPDVLSGTGLSNIFLWDRTTGQTILVSRTAGSPTTGGDDFSQNPRISADGSVVAFQSYASDLVAGQTDTAGSEDIFLFDRTTGTVSLVTRAAGSETVAANRASFLSGLSADGRIVAFTSNATDLVSGLTDTNEDYEAFLFDRVTGAMTLASRTTAPAPTAGGGLALALSENGRFLVFSSLASNLVPGQIDLPATYDLFLFDRLAGTTALVTHAAGSGSPTVAAGAGPGAADISADGRFIAFSSTSANLLIGQVDLEGTSDVFVLDRETGDIEMISRAAAGTPVTGGESASPRISDDGRRVAFFSNRLDLFPGLHGPGTGFNLYVHDRPSGRAILVTHVLGNPAQASSGDSPSFFLSSGAFLSANGTAVAFTSAAPGLVPRDFNRLPDAFAASVP